MMLQDLFPILKWGPKYTLDTAKADLVAGLTVGLMVVPQALAYATIAELPLQVCFCALAAGWLVASHARASGTVCP